MELEDYDIFAKKCVNELKIVQDGFQLKYNLDWYDRWFYDQHTGLLTFSKGDEELNFKYFEVGSFSERSNTWMWSWNNEHSLDLVKKKSTQVKEFGVKTGYSKLIDGYFKSDEYEAWEFTAIAFKLLGGIGVYRPVNDNQLQIFLVVTELVDNETANNLKEKYVECAAHDKNRTAFVCQHLLSRKKVGFEEAFETSEGMELSEDDDFQAWCNECETVRSKADGWNDTSMEFAQIKIVCEKCYFEMKEINLGHK